MLSLGAGVQSSCLALMAAKGEIGPMPDFAIFADTQSEPRHVYEWLDWLESELPFPVHRITKGQGLSSAILSPGSGRFAPPPFFTESDSVGGGMLRRQCTREYKVDIIQKEIRRLAGFEPRQRIPEGHVEQWIGISTDEIQRMKDAPQKWCNNRWPLIEKRMTRYHCLDWMQKNYGKVPGKSACTFCPYHDNATWVDMKNNDPESWEEAVKVDEAIRDGFGKTDEKLFVHRSLVPLAEVDFTSPEDNQLSFLDECDGMCGV